MHEYNLGIDHPDSRSMSTANGSMIRLQTWDQRGAARKLVRVLLEGWQSHLLSADPAELGAACWSPDIRSSTGHGWVGKQQDKMEVEMAPVASRAKNSNVCSRMKCPNESCDTGLCVGNSRRIMHRFARGSIVLMIAEVTDAVNRRRSRGPDPTFLGIELLSKRTQNGEKSRCSSIEELIARSELRWRRFVDCNLDSRSFLSRSTRLCNV